MLQRLGPHQGTKLFFTFGGMSKLRPRRRILRMGLLAEIQNDALSDTVPVATLLRKVMVLAAN